MEEYLGVPVLLPNINPFCTLRKGFAQIHEKKKMIGDCACLGENCDLHF